MSPSVPLRIVVADPQPLFRYGLRRLLENTNHIQLVGEGTTVAEAVHVVCQTNADVLVASVEPNGSGAETSRALAGLPHRVRCILITDGDQYGDRIAAERQSVGCLLPRGSSGGTFLSCIECVMRHQCWPVPRSMERQMTLNQPVAQPTPRRYRLTDRETQIVAAVADGGSNKDIAAQLAISEDTVKHHMSNIFDKVGVHSRLELAVFALYHGVVERETERRE
jgi:two-component system, NarL family, nitrate/nitrite response regulator NarL